MTTSYVVEVFNSTPVGKISFLSINWKQLLLFKVNTDNIAGAGGEKGVGDATPP